MPACLGASLLPGVQGSRQGVAKKKCCEGLWGRRRTRHTGLPAKMGVLEVLACHSIPQDVSCSMSPAPPISLLQKSNIMKERSVGKSRR